MVSVLWLASAELGTTGLCYAPTLPQLGRPPPIRPALSPAHSSTDYSAHRQVQSQHGRYEADCDADQGRGRTRASFRDRNHQSFSFEDLPDLLERCTDVALGEPDLAKAGNVGELLAPVFEHDDRSP